MPVTKFTDSPLDTITDILIIKERIFVSSWDCNVYVYDFNTQNLLWKIQNNNPILKLSWDDNLIYGDCSGHIYFYNLENNKQYSLNLKLKGINTIEICNGKLLVGGYDNKLCIIDNFKSELISLNNKVYGSIMYNNELFLNHGNKTTVYDIRTFTAIKEIRNKRQIRTMCIKSEKLYLGDINGKVKIHDLVTNEENIINAHFEMSENIKTVYPVNCIVNDDNIYTGGSDGIVYRWKDEGKLKCKKVFETNNGVLKMALYKKQKIICCGYNYEKGEGDTTRNFIYKLT